MEVESIKFSHGWYIPAHDQHLIEHFNTKQYTYKEKFVYQVGITTALFGELYKKKLRTAIDIGGFIGTFSYRLAEVFNRVHCFEPVAVHRECAMRNLKEFDNVKIHPFALGKKSGFSAMHIPKGAGVAAHLVESNEKAINELKTPEIEVRTLDSFGFSDVDFIKIDVEGYELPVISGALETIKKNRPIIVIEDLTKTEFSIKFLESLGMKRVFKVEHDFLLGWD